ncbi:MAG: hypothetical protein ABI794_13000 [Betaproteobacteria bacterium]
MFDPALHLNASVGKAASAQVSGIENKVKASMRAVLKGNWLETRDEALFRAGVGGTLLDVGKDSDEGRELTRSMDTLRKHNAAMVAADAGIGVKVPLAAGDHPPLPLLQWWREAKEA